MVLTLEAGEVTEKDSFSVFAGIEQFDSVVSPRLRGDDDDDFADEEVAGEEAEEPLLPCIPCNNKNSVLQGAFRRLCLPILNIAIREHLLHSFDKIRHHFNRRSRRVLDRIQRLPFLGKVKNSRRDLINLRLHGFTALLILMLNLGC